MIQEEEKVKVKLSGDGVRMSRVSKIILLCISILQSKDDLLSSKGHNKNKQNIDAGICVFNDPYILHVKSCYFKQVKHSSDYNLNHIA